MTRIAIIAGSIRPGRKARAVADWVHAIAAERDDADMTELTPAAYQAGLVHTMIDQVVAWSQLLRPLRAGAAPVAG